eukprot:UC4_evm5s1556
MITAIVTTFAASALAQIQPQPWSSFPSKGEVAIGITETVWSGSGCSGDPVGWWAGLAVNAGPGAVLGFGEDQDKCVQSMGFVNVKFPSACANTPDNKYSYTFSGKFPCASKANLTLPKLLDISDTERDAHLHKYAASRAIASIPEKTAPLANKFASIFQGINANDDELLVTFGGSVSVFKDNACTQALAPDSDKPTPIPGICSTEQKLPWVPDTPVYAYAVCNHNWIGGGGANTTDCWGSLVGITPGGTSGNSPGQCEPATDRNGGKDPGLNLETLEDKIGFHKLMSSSVLWYLAYSGLSIPMLWLSAIVALTAVIVASVALSRIDNLLSRISDNGPVCVCDSGSHSRRSVHDTVDLGSGFINSSSSNVLTLPLYYTRESTNNSAGDSNLGERASRRRAQEYVKLNGNAYKSYNTFITIDGQHFMVSVDTGSATTAVVANPALGCITSYTGECAGKKVSGSYMRGGFSGQECFPKSVSIGNLQAGNPVIVGITSKYNWLWNCDENAKKSGIYAVGILGMAYKNLQFSSPPRETVFDKIVDSNPSIDDIFSIQCCGWQSGGTGNLVLGGYDNVAQSNLNYSCVLLASKDSGAIEGRGTTLCQKGNALVDTGIWLLRLTPMLFKSALLPLANFLNVAVSDLTREYFTVCATPEQLRSYPPIRLEFEYGAVVLNIPATTYFQPSEAPWASPCQFELAVKMGGHDEVNILGQPVLEAYYTIFDRVNQMIGFSKINCN